MSTLYLTEQGARLSCDGDRLVVTREQTVLQHIPLVKLERVVIYGNVALTTPAIKRLLDGGVAVALLTQDGRYQGQITGAETPHAALRQAQYQRAADPAFAHAIAQRIVRGKLRNLRATLQQYARDRAGPAPAVGQAIASLARSGAQAALAQTSEALLGHEGDGTARYFAAWRQLLDGGWGFTHRQRRPPPDPVNALLSFGYTLLAQNVLGAVQAAGLDPYVGWLHRVSYNRPSLALDLMEEFRPLLVDRLVLRLCGDGTLAVDDFELREDPARPVVLGDAGRRRFLAAFEARMRDSITHPEGSDSGPGQVDYRRCIALQARRMARAVQGGAPYEPFAVR